MSSITTTCRILKITVLLLCVVCGVLVWILAEKPPDWLGGLVARKSGIEFKTPIPVGRIVGFLGPLQEIPDGWQLCDGSKLNIADYPKLFKIIGPSLSAADSERSTFSLPDFRGMFHVGVSGGTGGALYFGTMAQDSSAVDLGIRLEVDRVNWIVKAR